MTKYYSKAIILITITYLLTSCTHINKDNPPFNNNTTEVDYNTETNYDYEYADTSNLSQWALYNDGSFVYEGYFGSSWLTSNPVSFKGYDIGLNNIDKIFVSNRSTTIAVIDTYIDIEHYTFTNIWTNTNEIPQNRIDDDKNGYIDDINGWNFCDNSSKFINKDNSYHGTFMVGQLCGFDSNINFTSPLIGSNYEIMCIQAISNTTHNDIQNVIKAIKYAENNGSSICCLSFSTFNFNQELYDIIKDSSMLFIVAAGNESLNLDESDAIGIYPAKFDLDNIVVVTDMRSDGKLSEIANWGNLSVDIAAPGTDIISTAPDNQFIYSSGTSFAVSYVACAAALILQHSSEPLSALEIKEIIINSATHNANFNDHVLSEGHINIYSALLTCE